MKTLLALLALCSFCQAADLTTIYNRQSTTVTAVGSGTVTVNLTDLYLTAGNILKLEGNADMVFQINISRRFTLNGAKILLQGGLLPKNVHYNYNGLGSVTFGTGSIVWGCIVTKGSLSLSGRSIVYGTISARTIILTGASYYGL